MFLDKKEVKTAGRTGLIFGDFAYGVSCMHACRARGSGDFFKKRKKFPPPTHACVRPALGKRLKK